MPAGDAARASFSWDGIRDELGDATAGLNLGRLAVDRPVALGRADRVALRFLPAQGAPHDLTYGELARQTNGFANALRSLGVGPGDRVFVLAGRIAPLIGPQALEGELYWLRAQALIVFAHGSTRGASCHARRTALYLALAQHARRRRRSASTGTSRPHRSNPPS